MSDLKPIELWRAIILYGLNQASYKMALGKVLIDQTSIGGYEISWKQLSQRFLDAYIERIKQTGMPQQATSGRLTKMERIVSQLNLEKIHTIKPLIWLRLRVLTMSSRAFKQLAQTKP